MAEATLAVSLTQLNDLNEQEPKSLKTSYALTFLTGPQRGRQIKLGTQAMLRIGRSNECDVKIEDPSVSRVHADLFLSDKGTVKALVVRDRASRNGTWINGERLPSGESGNLAEGTKIRIGNEVVLRLDVVDELDEAFLHAMYEAAVKDPMTGAFNKRYLQDNLHRELALCTRYDLPASLLVLDVDFFKKINDTYGHQAGDLVLTRMAAAIRESLRAEDLLCRFGGEEFVLLAKNLNLAHAAAFAERIRRLVEGLDIVFDGKRIPVTVSIGIASTSERAYTEADAMLRDADEALYRAKDNGRNRVETFSLS